MSLKIAGDETDIEMYNSVETGGARGNDSQIMSPMEGGNGSIMTTMGGHPNNSSTIAGGGGAINDSRHLNLSH